MFKHLLVPLDGSTLAEAILPVVECFGAHLRIPVTLLHVVEPAAPATVHGDVHLMKANDAQAYLARVAEGLRAAGVEVDTHVDVAAGGEVARAIFAHGGELNADLILLTSHGRSGLRGILFGSIAQQVLQSGKIPVLLVKPHPEGTRPFNCKTIAVPLDSSSLYEPALDVSAELAQAFKATLYLLVVVPTMGTLSPERSATGMLLPSSTKAMLDLAQAGAVEYLQKKVDALKAQGLDVRAEVERGDITGKVIEVTERVAADLLVMATHGRAGLDAFWEGSIAPKVLARAQMPVLLLRVEGDEPVR